jgi:hypothetical protein
MSNNKLGFLSKKKKNGGLRAQGTIEYLVIIAIVVVIGLVVVSLLVGLMDADGVSSSVDKASNWSNTLALTETSVTTDGNYLVRLVNNDSDPVTITNVSIGGEDADYSEDLFMSSGQNFVISSSDVCDEGGKLANDVVITYVTKHGLVKTERYPANTYFECQDYSVTFLADQCEVCPTLVWSDYNGTPDTWYNHVNNCAAMNTGGFGTDGYLGWRLPTVDELDAVKETYIAKDEYLWTSSTVPSDTSSAYYLHSDDGYIGYDYKTNGNGSGVRCVRSE